MPTTRAMSSSQPDLSTNNDESATCSIPPSDISNETKFFFESLITRLEGKIERLEAKVSERDNRILDLESKSSDMNKRNDDQSQRIRALESKVIKLVQQNVELHDKLRDANDHIDYNTVCIDDNQQYQRKENLRIEGIPVTSDETNESLTTTVIKTFNDFGAKLNKSDIYRLHRSGRAHKSKKDGVKVAQVIVRFTKWSARKRAYRANHKAKDLKRREHIRVDLTKRRNQLLEIAKDALKGHERCHAYASAECTLLVKDRDRDLTFPFNTEAELEEILREECDMEPISDDASTCSNISIAPSLTKDLDADLIVNDWGQHAPAIESAPTMVA